ncbi:MAG: 16S rRNA (adenine(1518)-N(6)/adenine(1519)-N(6))-dimethyltransferase, partial [Thiotrichales bacterium]|nr:16S rRNA (adenine(1518)-N(6)/adenine(1519)-N(6))-dimethyltransferase [Thiotrichales bacterium]
EAPPCEIRDEELFKKIVTAAFSQRRKTLRNSLKSLVSAEQFQLAEIDPLRRAERLSLKEFAKLSLVAEN